MKWVFTICFIFLTVSVVGNSSPALYRQYEKLYEHYSENDFRALKFIDASIQEAKRLKDYAHLTLAYEDALYFSSSPETKLKLADSAITASIKSQDKILISRSYLGKGIVYYFNYKNYVDALKQYILAYKFSENIEDEYLKYKIRYHLGVVKIYLGYYDEAASLFLECRSFFKSRLKDSTLPNQKFNNSRGFLNSTHQLINAYQYSKKHSIARKLIEETLPQIGDYTDMEQERGYFLKCYGISKMEEKKYDEAENEFLTSASILKGKDDFAAIAINHFYLGKLNFLRGNREKALLYFKKVDSSFTRNNFMLPEIRHSYQYSILLAKNNNDKKEEWYSMKQLLKVDSILASDFPNLSSKIHRDYDTVDLKREQASLMKSKRLQVGVFTGSTLISLVIIGLLFRKNAVQRKININYKALIEKLEKGNLEKLPSKNEGETTKINYDEKIIEEILAKLKLFEDQNKFLQKGLTLSKLANTLKTNNTHLSFVINNYKGMNFTSYLKRLRINYITKALYENPKLLNYTVETLASECGISSRQVFSDHFYEINGIRPTDFINRRLKQLNEDKEKD